jgi:hypothetical protein
MTRNFPACATDRRKALVRGITIDLKVNIEPNRARDVISTQKSNAVSVDQFFELVKARAKQPRRDEPASLYTLEMAQVYRYNFACC